MPRSTMRRTFWIFAGVFIGLLLILGVVGDPARWPMAEAIPYQGEAADTAKSGHSPAALARLIREPQNTWSNLCFVAGGALLLGTGRTRGARAVGIPLIAVGAGSFLYHASASALLRQLDVGAMYWLFVMTAVYCLSVTAPKLRPRIERHAIALRGATCVAAVALTLLRNTTLFGFKPLSLTFATGIAAVVLILTLANAVHRTASVSGALQLLGIVNVFGIAVFLQLSDRPGGTLYRPEAVVQAHAAWHALAATALVWAIAVLDRHAGVLPPRTLPHTQPRKP